MNPETEREAPAAASQGAPTREAMRRHREAIITAVAVGAVALAALLAALASTRAKEVPAAEKAAAMANAPAATPVIPGSVVKAPPLTQPGVPATSAMGGAAACTQCGVVESVVAVQGQARGQTQTVGYLMNIRMDDGTLRMLEQRGALAAGSRVVVERDSVRAMGT